MSPPVGYINFGSLLHLIRPKKTGTDLDQRTVDEADEPLRQLLLKGEVEASIWAEDKLEPISADSWDDASFVLRACSGWLVAGRGLIVLPEEIVNHLSLSNAGRPSAGKLDFPVSIYLQMMLAWSEHVAAASDHKVWTKKEIEHWLKNHWPSGAGKVTPNELTQMAGLCRDPEYRKGGVKKNTEVQRHKRPVRSKA